MNRRILSQALVVGLLASALCLTGCGRKGPLEAPAATAVDTGGQPAPAQVVKKPNKPFFLDKLLE